MGVTGSAGACCVQESPPFPAGTPVPGTGVVFRYPAPLPSTKRMTNEPRPADAVPRGSPRGASCSRFAAHPGGSPMLDRLARLLQVSTPVAAMMIALCVVQVALLVFCLVDLARRDAVRGGRKWVW